MTMTKITNASVTLLLTPHVLPTALPMRVRALPSVLTLLSTLLAYVHYHVLASSSLIRCVEKMALIISTDVY